MFGAAAVRSLGRQLIDQPDLLTRRATLWLPVGSAIDVAAKQDSDRASEQLVDRLEVKGARRRQSRLTESASELSASVGFFLSSASPAALEAVA